MLSIGATSVKSSSFMACIQYELIQRNILLRHTTYLFHFLNIFMHIYVPNYLLGRGRGRILQGIGPPRLRVWSRRLHRGWWTKRTEWFCDGISVLDVVLIQVMCECSPDCFDLTTLVWDRHSRSLARRVAISEGVKGSRSQRFHTSHCLRIHCCSLWIACMRRDRDSDTDKNKALTVFRFVLSSSWDILDVWATARHADNFIRISSRCIVEEELKMWTDTTRTRPDRMHDGEGKKCCAFALSRY